MKCEAFQIFYLLLELILSVQMTERDFLVFLKNSKINEIIVDEVTCNITMNTMCQVPCSNLDIEIWVSVFFFFLLTGHTVRTGAPRLQCWQFISEQGIKGEFIFQSLIFLSLIFVTKRFFSPASFLSRINQVFWEGYWNCLTNQAMSAGLHRWNLIFYYKTVPLGKKSRFQNVIN